MGERRRICDIALEVLVETDNNAIMWGDGLLDEVHKRSGGSLGVHPLKRWQRILNALTRTPGDLVPMRTRINGRWYRIFYRPDAWSRHNG
jgi:hypothetical protein